MLRESECNPPSEPRPQGSGFFATTRQRERIPANPRSVNPQTHDPTNKTFFSKRTQAGP
jgi:hypothetical protein